jgi:hypothetical protein
MLRENSFKSAVRLPGRISPAEIPLHPAWHALIEYCNDLVLFRVVSWICCFCGTTAHEFTN